MAGVRIYGLFHRERACIEDDDVYSLEGLCTVCEGPNRVVRQVIQLPDLEAPFFETPALRQLSGSGLAPSLASDRENKLAYPQVEQLATTFETNSAVRPGNNRCLALETHVFHFAGSEIELAMQVREYTPLFRGGDVKILGHIGERQETWGEENDAGRGKS